MPWPGHDPGVRSDDPDTSARAADDVRAREGSVITISKGTQKHLLLNAYRLHPSGLIPHEAGEVAGIPGGWRRCSDLLSGGFIELTGDVRPSSASGKDGQVARITETGLRKLTALGSLL